MSIDEYIKLLLEEPHKKSMAQFNVYENVIKDLAENRPTELEKFKAHLMKVGNVRNQIAAKQFILSLEVVLAKITDDLAQVQDNWLSGQEDAYAKLDNEIQALKTKIEQENKLHNQMIVQQNTQNNQVYVALEQKRKLLEGYADKIYDECSKYGITSSDVNIDETNFTVEELDSLYDEYTEFMQKEEHGSNIVSKFRSVVPDRLYQGAVLLILLILCFTPILNVAGIVFFGLLVYTQMMNVKRYKYYTVLLGLVFNVRPERLGYTDLDQSLFLPEDMEPYLDTDERFAHFEAEYDRIESSFTKEDPALIHQKTMSEWEQAYPKNLDRLNEMKEEFNTTYNNTLKMIDEEIEVIKAAYEKAKAEYKPFGTRITRHYTFKGLFSLGVHDDCIEEHIEIGHKNIIIRPNRNEELMTRFLQTMVVNAWENVAPRYLKIIVYDPNNMGRSLMALYQKSLDTYFEFHNDSLDKILTALIDTVQNNLKLMKGKTIEEYNKICEESGMIPIGYQLLIILSQPKTVEEDEKLKSLFSYSPDGGVFMWVVSPSLNVQHAVTIKEPFEGIKFPYTKMITDKWCSEVSTNYNKAIEKARPAGLPWTDFIKVAVPPEKSWNVDTDNAMDLFPGFENGDPGLCKPYTIGNEGNVHVLNVGGTGAGKSVFLNHIIATVTMEYSPKDVELWLCDFKGTEFKFYLPSLEYNFMLPHIKACLCTSDGDYATSLFRAYRNMADHRYDVLKNPNMFLNELAFLPDGETVPNQKDTVGWNRYWRKRANDTGDKRYLDNIWPRVLFICDEFQVIFEKAEPKSVDQIREDITQIAKVGRAANVHIFFASQSMNKTLSADILQQFTLRFALRCDPAVSKEILNTSKASDIKDKFGFLIVKATGIADADQPKYKTPYFKETQELRDHVKNMYDRAIEMNIPMKDVITYEEITKHDISELTELYNKEEIQEIIPNSGVFFLGNRMVYSTNKVPDNIVLSKKNNTHIMSCFADYTDYVMWFNTLMTNIKSNKVPGTIIINSQVDDLAYITDAKSYITYPDRHGYLLSSDISCKEMGTWLQKVMDRRSETGKTDEPLWVFLLGWDKGKGFAIDLDIQLRSSINNILQTAGVLNIHIIFINTSITGITDATTGACKYIVAGKCSESDSFALLGNKLASKAYDMKTGWLFSKHDGEITRDKLYISNVVREIEKTEIVL